MPRPPQVPKELGDFALNPLSAQHFTSSDGALEIDVPATAINTRDVAAAGGNLSLLVRQVEPASGSNAGGSGQFTFGTFMIQLVDAHGQLVQHGLRQPLGLKLHYGSRGREVDVAHAIAIVNNPLPPSIDLNAVPTSTPSPPSPRGAPSPSPRAPSPASRSRSQPSHHSPAPNQTPTPRGAAAPAHPVVLGPATKQKAMLDASDGTLSTTVPSATASTAVSFNTDSAVATFGSPDPFTTDLSGGALTTSIPLDLPSGPGGLTPPLQLAYNSADVNGQHNAQGAASWVGEGWNLSLGGISWAEHDVASGRGGTFTDWEDSWQLADPYGTAVELIPPNISIATFNQDAPNQTNPNPVVWHTAPETRDKVVSYLGQGNTAPCFRVFRTNGIIEEFGCTPDSIAWYVVPSGPSKGNAFMSSWLPDLITDPMGNQIHITYQGDWVTASNGQAYPRDVVPATVEYDSPTCHNAQTSCSGPAWQPLVRLNFDAAHAVSHVAGSSCAASGTLRCDDPADLSGSGGLASPAVQSTFVLNDVEVQVRANGSSAWNTLRDYRLSYDQSGPTTIKEPAGGLAQSVAGKLTLTQFQEIGDDGSTALPPHTFTYTQQTETFVDDGALANPQDNSNCGPSWNMKINGHCILWSQSYAGNSYYLASMSNGLGLSETFSWQNARSNSFAANFYSPNGIGNNSSDPLYCTNASASIQSSAPCSVADDREWSRIVLTQRSQTVVRLAQAGQGGTQSSQPVTTTTSFSYRLAYPLREPDCSNDIASFYWGGCFDTDRFDFYNRTFMGFAQATVTNADGGVQTHKFHTTEGAGLYDSQQVAPCNTPGNCPPNVNSPWWDLDNAAHGHEYELDQYGTDGTTLLSKILTQWRAVCPPSGVPGSPPVTFNDPIDSGTRNWHGNLVSELEHSNPVVACEIQKVQDDSYQSEGSSGPPVHKATTYGYDGLGRETSVVESDSPSILADSSGHGAGATWGGNPKFGMPGLVSGDTATSMTLDGATSFVQLPSIAFGNYPTSGSTNGYSLSFEAWFQTTSGGVILSQTDGAPPSGSLTTGHVPALYVDTQGAIRESLFWHGAVQNVATGPFNDGHPHHVVATYSNGVDSLYVDGKSVASTTQAEASYSSTYSYVLGTGNTNGWPNGNGAWYSFNGALDQVAIYGLALSPARVQAHFTAGSGYRAAVLADAPSAYYRLDEAPAGGTSPIVHRMGYVQNDAVSATASSATGTYLIDPEAFSDLEDLNGNRYQCSYTSYDGQSFATGQTSALTLGEVTETDRYTNCGTPANGFATSGKIATTNTYDASGNEVATSDADANAGDSAHLGCVVGGTKFSTCTSFDGTFNTLQSGTTNARSQQSTIGYLPPTLADSSGNGHPATWGGTLTLGAPGLVSGNSDTAVAFDGSTGSVTAPPQTPLQSDNARSLELWFSTTFTTQQGILDAGNVGTNAQGLQLGLTQSGGVGGSPSQNTPGLYLAYWGADVYLPGLNLLDGLPHHVVTTLSGSSVFLYVDGTTPNGLVWNGSSWGGSQAQPFTLPIAPSTAAKPLLIGQTRAGIWGVGSSFFNGALNEVAVYDHVLGADRVQAHHSAGSGYQAAVLADTPISYYRLNDPGSGRPSSFAGGGFGLWPVAKTDVNGQTTTTTYDALGRETGESLPGELPGATTDGTSYSVFCSGSAAQAPCVEVDKTQRLNPTTTVTAREFYDGLGRPVETRTQGPIGDIVQYKFYDASGRLAFQSVPYGVGFYTGGPGPSAYSIPDTTQPGTTYSYDALGRQISAVDALSGHSTTSRTAACGAAGTNDGNCYVETLSVDANGHRSGTLVDGLGRTIYEQRFTGSSAANYAAYATESYSYDFNGELVQILQPDGLTQSSFTYDMAGRKTGMVDPDLGTQSYSYDPNGNVVQSIDARGSAGTIFTGFDALDRPIWRNTSNTPSGAYDTFSYDSTANGNLGIGRLTGETFAAGSLAGSRSTVYNARGQVSASILTVGSSSYSLLSSYDDAGNTLTERYPDGETITNSHTAQGWLSGVSTTSASGTTTTLLSNVGYNGKGGARQQITQANLGGTAYQLNTNWDDLGREWQVNINRLSDNTTQFNQHRALDAVGNVVTSSTTLPGGTDNQAFCYDELDRLTWAGSTGTAPCSGSAVSTGTLTAADYTSSFSYDRMGRLTSGPQGNYQYGDPAHVHAATAIGNSYTASYDAAGGMTCRAPSNASTCVGSTPTGAQLSYDNDGRLASWQSAPSSPNSSATFLYDGSGQRVAEQVMQAGTATITVYVGNQEEISTTGGTTTTTAYYLAGSQRIALSVNGTVSYLANDLLGSPTVSLGSNGTPGGSVLYGPYGAVRYSSGTMATTYGFTGQRTDAVTGLDYYGARYYDPVGGQFTSGDVILPNDGMDVLGLSRYAYVDGNPTARTDPTGHRWVDDGCGGCTYDNHGFGVTAAYRRWQDQMLQFREHLREQSEARRRAASRRWADFFRLLDEGGLGGIDGGGGAAGDPAIGEAAAGGGPGLRAFLQLAWNTVMDPAYDGEYFVQRIQGRLGGDSSTAARGRAMHEAFKAFEKAAWDHDVDWESEPTIRYQNSYLKPDALYDGKPVELKPNTSSGRSAGLTQIRRYMSATRSNVGYLVFYDADGGFTVQVVKS